MTSDRQREWTRPPGAIAFAAPQGAVTYLEAHDREGLAGWLWITDDVGARPRAGIILAPRRVRPCVSKMTWVTPRYA